LRDEEKERNESPGGGPVYFHLLKREVRDKSRKGPDPGNSIFSDLPPPFRTTENFPGTAQNLKNPSEKCCTNPAYQVWEQAQAKLETDLKEYQQMNTNLVASLVKVTKEIQTEMTERVAEFMKNFDKVSTVLTRIITAEGLCIYC
jgi:hypothetical protein